ncbi:hypothetical protein ACIQ7D_16755 [Streptomyces sp. NPDC096310]|uniref:hypothetical protein n=1 Tax=Streptomyces sp. NPDC096310 TaxID=3366082 RepID=UPI0038231D18
MITADIALTGNSADAGARVGTAPFTAPLTVSRARRAERNRRGAGHRAWSWSTGWT